MATEAEPLRKGISDTAVHPGELLVDELEVRGVTPAMLAVALGRSSQFVHSLLRGRRPIDADTAVALERALGISARFWLNHQASFDLTRAYKRAAG